MSSNGPIPIVLPRSYADVDTSSSAVNLGGMPSMTEYASMTATTPAVAPAAPTESMEAMLVQALKNCWLRALVLGGIAAAAATALVWFAAPPKYTTQALIFISAKEASSLLRPHEGGGAGDDFSTFQRTHMTLIKGRQVLSTALQMPEMAQLDAIRDNPQAGQWLADAIKVDTNLSPEIMRVSLSGDDPSELAAILNGVVRAFVDEVNRRESHDLPRRLDELEQKYVLYEDSLQQKRTQLRELQERLGIEEPQTLTLRYQSALQKLAVAEKELLQARINLRNTEMELTGARELEKKSPAPSNIPDLSVEEYLQRDPSYQKLLSRQTQLDEQVSQLARVVTPERLEELARDSKAQLAALNKQLEARRQVVREQMEHALIGRPAEAGNVRLSAATLERRVRLFQEQLQYMQQEVDRQTKEVERIAKALRSPDQSSAKLDSLKSDIAQAEETLKRAATQIDLLRMEPHLPPRVSLMEAAEEPRSIDVKRQMKLAAVAGMGMFGLLVLAIGFHEARSRRVHRIDDVAHGLGMRVVGAVPALPAALVGSKLVAPGAALKDSVDAIRLQLIQASQREGVRVVMLTSAIENEGHSALATQLAASLARVRRKVLLIDGNIRNPEIHQQLKMPLTPGLCDVLRGQAAFEDVVRGTGVTGLTFMAAGTWDEDAFQALVDRTDRSLFQSLREEFDFVIVNAGPVLLAPDSLLLGQHADGTILTVMRNVSRIPSVAAASQRLMAAGTRLLGTVVVGAGRGVQHLSSLLAPTTTTP